jgi:hypothetical protein
VSLSAPGMYACVAEKVPIAKELSKVISCSDLHNSLQQPVTNQHIKAFLPSALL